VASITAIAESNFRYTQVQEGASADDARAIADMKKPAMAENAERLLAGRGWLPAILRAPDATAVSAEGEAVEPEAQAA
jgi:ParB family chromosome partitioning protein